MELKGGISFANGSGLAVVPKADEEAGGQDCAVVVERNMSNVKRKEEGQGQASIISNETKEELLNCSIWFVKLCLFYLSLSMTERWRRPVKQELPF